MDIRHNTDHASFKSWLVAKLSDLGYGIIFNFVRVDNSRCVFSAYFYHVTLSEQVYSLKKSIKIHLSIRRDAEWLEDLK